MWSSWTGALNNHDPSSGGLAPYVKKLAHVLMKEEVKDAIESYDGREICTRFGN